MTELQPPSPYNLEPTPGTDEAKIQAIQQRFGEAIKDLPSPDDLTNAELVELLETVAIVHFDLEQVDQVLTAEAELRGIA